jgi:hypothetical protein
MARTDQSKTIERQREKWRKVRARGKQRFVITRGVLIWGISTFIVENVVVVFADFYWLHRPYIRPSLGSLTAQLIAFCFTGYFYGLWFWSWHERNFGQ